MNSRDRAAYLTGAQGRDLVSVTGSLDFGIHAKTAICASLRALA
jgi:hypothetical protein